MAQLIFWTSFILLGYAYLGYPIILSMVAAIGGRKSAPEMRHLPTVTLLLSVFNEERVIAGKIANFRALDYPADRLEFIIVSDGCSDRTEEIVRSAALCDPRIRLLVQERRGGKTRALNRGAEEARGEILVFTDANALFDPAAVKMLARHFADPGVGLVGGTSHYFDAATGRTVPAGLYRRYEDRLKAGEGMSGGIVGADGAIYALRRDLYEPLPPEYINDFIHPVQVATRGFRAIQDNEAVCREPVDGGETGEMRRQTRIMAQSWRIFCTQITGLVRAGRIVYAWQFVTHKFLRWLTLPFLAAFCAATLALAAEGVLYQLALAGQAALLLLAAAGSRGASGLARVAFLFFLIHAAAITGLIRYLRGTAYVTWNPRES